jgi:hypothetical protein
MDAISGCYEEYKIQKQYFYHIYPNPELIKRGIFYV